MKRALLPASALVLVVTACGAGAATSAPRVTEVSARPPSVEIIAARRKRDAALEARRLLREFVVPPGALSTPQPRRYGGVLDQSGATPIGEVVDVHRFWSVRKPLATVAAFVRTHRLAGFRGSGATYGTNAPHYLMWSFSSQATRYLDVTAVALPGRTVLRVDAQVVWVYSRSPRERVPAATRKIVIHAPETTQTVTDPAKVARIVDRFDALPISPPGIVLSCPLVVAAQIRLFFLDARGNWLAQASLPSTSAWVCNTIGLKIGGKTQKPLIDSRRGESFVARLQGLLGVRLVQNHR